MIYTKEVQNMCPVAKGAKHEPAPIPEEGKWVHAKKIEDISGFTHGIGWCAPQQGACKLTLNVKQGVIEEALVETIGCSGMTHSAAMAAEIGTMRVSEQIDALITLNTNPFKYLIAPRVLAGILMMPVLVLIGDILGVCGGYLVGVYKMDFNASTYLINTWNYLKPMDIISGLTKAAVFGFIIALMGCYNGFRSKGGAQGVGQATTNAVVSASILILIFNYLLTEAFFNM